MGAICHALWIAIFRATLAWPIAERHGIAAQIKRAALSAGANIAEGAARRGPREYARHLNIAVGSLAEVEYLLRAAKDVELLDPDTYERLQGLQRHAGRVTMLLYRAVRQAAGRAPH